MFIKILWPYLWNVHQLLHPSYSHWSLSFTLSSSPLLSQVPKRFLLFYVAIQCFSVPDSKLSSRPTLVNQSHLATWLNKRGLHSRSLWLCICNHSCSSIIRMSSVRSINTTLGTSHSMHDMYAPWPIFPECLRSFTALPGHLE